jgi:hypothetical protein
MVWDEKVRTYSHIRLTLSPPSFFRFAFYFALAELRRRACCGRGLMKARQKRHFSTLPYKDHKVKIDGHIVAA